MGDLVRRHFERQAEACARLHSPFTARLLNLAAARLAAVTNFSAQILDWPDARMRDDALALRFAGALHAAVLSGRAPGLASLYPAGGGADADDDALWHAILGLMQDEDAFLSEILTHPPQTNETGRAAVLMLGFQAVARATGLPLGLLELGASAGLNQNWDRFHYDLGGSTFGDRASAVHLKPEWRGRAPDLQPITVRSRAGCDRNPLNVGDPAECLRLRSYIWPDQPERLARLDGAIAIARDAGLRLARADAADWAAASLMTLTPGQATTVYHSIFWQYLPQETQDNLRSTIEVAGSLATADTPFAWVRMEPWEEDPKCAALFVTVWPDPERQVLALCDYHGRWIEPRDPVAGQRLSA